MRKIQWVGSVAITMAAACLALEACSSDSSTPEATTDSGVVTNNDANAATDTSTSGDSSVSDGNLPDASDAGSEAAAGGSAVWTLAPNPTCTSTVPAAVICTDTGAAGGYQLAAGAQCALNNGLTIYLPGGSVPAAGTYTVKPASSLFDLVNLTAGQVAIRAIHHPNGTTQEEWFAQSGTVAVTNTGGKLGYAATNLPTNKAGVGTATTLTLTATCN